MRIIRTDRALAGIREVAEYIARNFGKKALQEFRKRLSEWTKTIKEQPGVGEIDWEISTADRLFVKYGSDYADGGDEVVIIPEDEGTINVAWFIYEFMALAVPMRHVHPDGECNPEMMKKLSAHLSNDDVMLDDMQDGEKPIDPRWNDLKNLLDNN